jgi:hypothetical protein
MDSIAIKQLPYPIAQSESAKAITAARAFWFGQLRISLVTFGINLIPAATTSKDCD